MLKLSRHRYNKECLRENVLFYKRQETPIVAGLEQPQVQPLEGLPVLTSPEDGLPRGKGGTHHSCGEEAEIMKSTVYEISVVQVEQAEPSILVFASPSEALFFMVLSA